MTGDWFESAISVTSLMTGFRQRVIEILKSSFRSKENRMRKWTFMLYMAADDVLANFAVKSLMELESVFRQGVTKSNVIDVIVKAQLGVERSVETPVFRRYIFCHQTRSSQDRTCGSDEWTSLATPSHALSNPASINANAVCSANDIDMTDPKELEEFIDWAYDPKEKEEDRSYCLIFWGHGPELLYDPPERERQRNGAKQKKRFYFTPIDLKNALEGTELVKADKERKRQGKETTFKIIGMDACCMSTIEFAYELKDLADLMVASQENVPDPSFPYTDLMKRFQTDGNDPEKLCKDAVGDYVQAYWDYVPDPGDGIKPVTLSALRLRKTVDDTKKQRIDHLKAPIKMLVQRLEEALRSPEKERMKEAILKARKSSHGFVGGLFVDLRDFCDKLTILLRLEAAGIEIPCTVRKSMNAGIGVPEIIQELGKAGVDYPEIAKRFAEAHINVPPATGELLKACIAVSNVINQPETPGFILANEVAPDVWAEGTASAPSSQCHGLSIYFPYLTDSDKTQIESSSLLKVKGLGGAGGGPGAKDSEIVNLAAKNVRYDVRREFIKDTENYYGKLQFSEDTGWHEFIKCYWSRILAEKARDAARENPKEYYLDSRYSAERCAINLVYEECTGRAKGASR